MAEEYISGISLTLCLLQSAYKINCNFTPGKQTKSYYLCRRTLLANIFYSRLEFIVGDLAYMQNRLTMYVKISNPKLQKPKSRIFVGFRYIVRSLRFCLHCYKARKNQRADIVICHDTLTALAAWIRSGFMAKNIVYDVTETPNLKERTTNLFRSMPTIIVFVLEKIDIFIGKRCSLILTSSPGFLEDIQNRYGKKATLVLNYSQQQRRKKTGRSEILFELGVPDDTKLIAWPSSFTELTGANFALDTLKKLPDNWHMVVVGNNEPTTLQIQQKLAGLSKKITFFPILEEREDYLDLIDICDIGWVLFCPRFQNLRNCLPNRFLDLVSLGKPVVCSGEILAANTRLNFPIFSQPYGNADLLKINSIEALKHRDFPPPSVTELQEFFQATTFDSVMTPESMRMKYSSDNENYNRCVIVASRSIANRDRIKQLALSCDKIFSKTETTSITATNK